MPERLQVFGPEYFKSPGSPKRVVHETGVLFPLYFSESLRSYGTGLAMDFFRGHTLKFISDATRGFFVSRDFIRAQVREEELRRFQAQRELTTGTPEVDLPYTKPVESYGLTLVILSQMQTLAQQPGYFIGRPHWPLRLPTSSMEMADRLDELERFVKDTIKGVITPENIDLLDDSVKRALAFFQVGRDLLAKERPSKAEIKDKLEDTSNLDEEIKRVLRNTPLN